MKRLSLLFVATLAFGLVRISVAQEVGSPGAVPSEEIAPLAEINLSDARIVSRDADTIRVGFTLSNQGVVPQSDIRYGLQLVREDGEGRQGVADFFVVRDAVTIDAGAETHLEFSYATPAFLSGEYSVLVSARTTGGLMLGVGNAGAVTFPGDGTGITLEDCYLLTAGADGLTYALGQGVDVDAIQRLDMVCSAENHATETVSVRPVFETYRRSVFGEQAEVEVAEDASVIDFGAGEKKTVFIPVPKAAVPQAYDAVMTLVSDVDGRIVSERVVAHYVVRGPSATIQNATLDRDSYAKGDPIVLLLSFTPSADGFIGSSVGADGSRSAGYLARFSVVGSDGKTCAEISDVPIFPSGEPSVLIAESVSECASPRATVSLADSEGNRLDERMIESPGTEQATTSFGGITLRSALFAFVAFLFVVSIALIALRSFRRPGKPLGRGGMKATLFVATALAGSALFSGEASAATWNNNEVNKDYVGTFSNGEPYNYTKDYATDYTAYTASTDKTEYASGDRVTVKVSAAIQRCENSHEISMTAMFDGGYSGDSKMIVGTSLSGELGFYVPSSASVGPHTVVVRGCTEAIQGEPWCGQVSIPITVSGTSGSDDGDGSEGGSVVDDSIYVSMGANPRDVCRGETSRVEWFSRNADSCVATSDVPVSGWSGPQSTTQWSPGKTVGPFDDLGEYILTLTCENSSTGETGSDTETISTLPRIFLYGDIDTWARPGDAVVPKAKVRWYANSVNSCVASGAWSGNKDVDGSESFPLSDVDSHTYTLTCENSYGDSTTESVTLHAEPRLFLTATPTDVNPGASSMLSWGLTPSPSDTSGITCDLYNYSDEYDFSYYRTQGHGEVLVAGNLSASGSRSTGPLTRSTRYGMDCSGWYYSGNNRMEWSEYEGPVFVNVISPSDGSGSSSLYFCDHLTSYPASDPIERPSGSSVTMAEGEYRYLTAHYGAAGDCGIDSDVTTDTTFSEDASEISATKSGSRVRLEAVQEGTGAILHASYATSVADLGVTVVSNEVPEEPEPTPGNSRTTNWREVAPGE